MTFQETLDFLYQQLPVFHKIGIAAYKKDLSRTLALLKHFDDPHLRLKCIHIAGTNGKGSSSHFLASILQEAGYKTGLYTSPHVKHFGERIKINGQFIEEDYVIQFVEEVRPLLPEIEPSFFELTVAMAFHYFEKSGIDIAIIETGLGGRLDSTNVVNPLVSLITNISYDHMDILGSSLVQIATEKAGIIKPQTPVVIGERQEEVEKVFEEAASANGSTILFASDHYKISKIGYSAGKMDCLCTVSTNPVESKSLLSGLIGNYQLKNLPGVLQTVEVLKKNGLDISDKAVEKGLKFVVENTGFKGRWQILQENPLLVCDIAHNASGISEVLKTADAMHPTTLHIVFGVVKDKDVDKVLQLLPTAANYYFTEAHIPRALPASELQAKAKLHSLVGDTYENVELAIEKALSKASEDDLVLVCGSTFIVAEVAKI